MHNKGYERAISKLKVVPMLVNKYVIQLTMYVCRYVRKHIYISNINNIATVNLHIQSFNLRKDISLVLAWWLSVNENLSH